MKAINTVKQILVIFFMVSASALAKAPWLTSIEEGVKQAEKEGKLVMVEFTGSDWCPPCMMMNKKVFSQEEFLKGAQKNYVLVKLDAPKSDKKLAKSTGAVMKKYKIKGFPTILLLDASGKEFKRFTATENPSVKSFLKRLKTEKRRAKML